MTIIMNGIMKERLFHNTILLVSFFIANLCVKGQNSSSNEFGYSVAPETSSSDSRVVGSPQGTFNVTDLGGASYSVVIEVPKGLQDMQPELSIVYNSQSGNGICGWGCNLSGISVITRGVRDIYHDGIVTGITHGNRDAFYLDGVRLIESEYTEGSDTIVYYLENDPYCRVVQHCANWQTQSSIWFSVQTQDGLCREYGRSGCQQLYSAGKVNAWFISRVEDALGAYMTYEYMTDQLTVYPQRIRYGNSTVANNPLDNQVVFGYETRPDEILFAIEGNRGKTNKRLSSITSKTGNNVYRSYNLSYNSSDGTIVPFSRLSSITLNNGQGETMKPIAFSWNNLPNFQASVDSPILPMGALQGIAYHKDKLYSTGDYNGDGLCDIMERGYTYFSGNTNPTIYDHPYYRINYAKKRDDGSVYFVGGIEGAMTCDSYDDDYISLNSSLLMADLNHDGATDLLFPYKRVSPIYRYVGFEVNFINDARHFELIYNLNSLNCKFCAGDFNNDACDELVIVEDYMQGNSFKGGMLWLDDEGQSHQRDFQFCMSEFPVEWMVADMNRDGLSDIVAFQKRGYTVFWNDGAWNGTGAAVTPNSTTFIYTQLSGIDISIVRMGDFNADGCADFLFGRKGESSWYIAYGVGDGSTQPQVAFTSDIKVESWDTTQDINRLTCMVYDFDGDGRSDLFLSKDVYQEGSPKVYLMSRMSWLRSNGTSLVEIKSAVSNQNGSGASQYFTVGDFNGDGLCELAANSVDCWNSQGGTASSSMKVYYNNGFNIGTGKIHAFNDGYGRETSVEYKSLTDEAVYKKNVSSSSVLPFPVQVSSQPLAVVWQMNGFDGSKNTLNRFSYQNLMVHSQGLGTLGFEKRSSKDMNSGEILSTQVIEWYQDVYIPQKVIERREIGDNLQSSVVKEYSKVITVPILRASEAYDFDGNSLLQEYQYYTTDAVLPCVSIQDHDDGNGNQFNYSDYIYCKGRWLPQIVERWVYRSDDFVLEENQLEYDNRGLLTRKTVRPEVELYADDPASNNQYIITEYEYDAFGNVLLERTIGSDMDEAVTEYEYDSTHRFVTMKRYKGKQTNYIYDLWGNLLSESDATRPSYHLTITYSYDGWDNVIEKSFPDGKRLTIQRGWGQSPQKCYFELVQGTSRPWVKTWYDAFGHEVLKESVGSNDINITSSFTYDSMGQVVRKEQRMGALTTIENYTYDNRGRVQTCIDSNGRALNYTYGRRTTSWTDCGRQYSCTYDARGYVLSSAGPNGNAYFEPSVLGKPKSIMAHGSTLTTTYDDLGHQTSMNDPDAGINLYEYDVSETLRKWRTADGCETTFLYDSFGELAQKTSPGCVSVWTHPVNASDPNRGLLTNASCGSNTVSYEYDGLSRVTRERWNINNGGQSLLFTYTYNTLGQLVSKYYPGGVTASYVYDSYGNHVGTLVNGVTVWELHTNDGRTTVKKHGNNLVFKEMLDEHGYMSHQSVTYNNDTLLKMDYVFNPITGNLSQRSGSDLPVESFSYDACDRLIGVQGQTNMIINYASNGNILYKTNMGHYDYSMVKPHAVVGVENTYNLMPRTLLKTRYNSIGKIEEIEDVDTHERMTFSYGADDQRCMSTLYDGDNHILWRRYYCGDYEIQTGIDGTYRFYYVADNVVCVWASPSGASPSFSIYHVATDHQGNIIRIFDDAGTTVFHASYDAWGLQNVLKNDIAFFRGYTGHEMLTEFGLINMNGRLYDPLLGRFLSVDNYVQEPYNTQSYNRYSYCLNNPLKYTDPSGDEFVFSFFSGFTMGIIDLFKKKEHSIWTPFIYAAKNVYNDFKIDLGLLKGNFKQVLSRFTWESPQTFLGYSWSEIRLAFFKIDDVRYFDGATFVIAAERGDHYGVSLGNYINITDRVSIPFDKDGNFSPMENPLYMHEYGHYLQSQSHGPIYLFSIGLPSLYSAITKDRIDGPPLSTHAYAGVEMDANRRAAKYFGEKYGVDWNAPYNYPFKKEEDRKKYYDKRIVDYYPLYK